MEDQFVFWNGDGKIVPHLLYEFFVEQGIGNYFNQESEKKNADPVMVKINENIVSPVNVGYLLDLTKNYIIECTSESGDAGPILDSLHSKTSLFSDKNLKLLKTLHLEFITDTPEYGYFFFNNGVVQVSADGIELKQYDDFDRFVWEKSIIQMDYVPIEADELEHSDFMRFLNDLVVVDEPEKAGARYKSLSSAIGYLLHRHKNPATTKAIILMDVYVNGQPNGGSGKSLLVTSVGKLRNLSTIDGKKYDQREWFALSSVDLSSEVLLFDDLEKNFNFEQIFPILTTGMLVRLKYKNHVFLPFEKAPKVALTTNYAILGDSSSHRRRKFEFEISSTYSASFTPRDKFGRNFFDGWDDAEYNRFYNVMFGCLQVFLKNGLIESEPINLSLTKLVYKTSEEFVDWVDNHIEMNIQYDKKALYDKFVKVYPEFSNKLKQRDFTFWLRSWGEYKKLETSEGHSGDMRWIRFSSVNIQTSEIEGDEVV